MAISTYTELQAAVANWLSRADLTERIPEFITLTEAKFNRVLRCNQMEKRSYTAVDTTSTEPEFITLPSDYQTMRRMRISSAVGKPRVEFVNQLQADDYRYSVSNSAGRPLYFTVVGDEMELIPTPDDDYTIEMVYRANIPALASNSTNWLLTLAPDAYLYGALMEAAPYLEEDPRVQVWAPALAQAVSALNELSAEKTNAGPLTIKAPGYNP